MTASGRRSRRRTALLGLICAVAGSVLLAGSAPGENVQPTAFDPSRARAIFHEGVRYSEDAVLDVLLPPTATPPGQALSPVVVLLHGCCGDRSDLGKLAEAISDAGIVVFNADWPGMGATAHFPAAYEAVACAVRYAQTHAREFSSDPARVIVAGWSDGAMVAAVVSAGGPTRADPRCAGGQGSTAPTTPTAPTNPTAPAAPAAVVGIGGFYGWPLPVLDKYVVPRAELFFGGAPDVAADAWTTATPYHWLASAPPTYLLVGTTDPLVDDARRYATALMAAGRTAHVIEIRPGGDQTLISPRSPEGRRVVAEIASVARSLGTESEK